MRTLSLSTSQVTALRNIFVLLFYLDAMILGRFAVLLGQSVPLYNTIPIDRFG